MSMMIYRGGPGSVSAAEVHIDRSGQITLISGLMEVGEGATTVLAQMAADVLGVGIDDIAGHFADTSDTPDAPITAGSTATFSTGAAVVQAASEVRERLLQIASVGLEAPVMELDISEGAVFVRDDPARRMSIPDLAGRMAEDHRSASATITPGSPGHIVNSFGAHFVEVEVDTATGRVRVLRYVAAKGRRERSKVSGRRGDLQRQRVLCQIPARLDDY